MSDTTSERANDYIRTQALVKRLTVNVVQRGLTVSPDDDEFTRGWCECYAYLQDELRLAGHELAALARTNATQQRMLVELAHRVLMAERLVQWYRDGTIAG